MDKLKIQINKKVFNAILSGELKTLSRDIYPDNAKRYVTEVESKDENGEDIVIVNPIKYDALVLVNGRRENAPRMEIEVKDSEFVVLTDENGEDLYYECNGVEYYVCQVWYTLGSILSSENIQE